MKKTVIIILAVLPIVLLITIAFAGRIFSVYRHVAVEKVRFVDDGGQELDSEYVFTINVGEEKETNIRIFPDLASNKSVTYTSSDESICTVDSSGKITGVSIGTTSILVKTTDGGKTDMLTVRVKADYVTGVTLPYETLELPVGATQTLTATIEPYSAINKNVTYFSDAPSIVSVNANGKLTAHAPGVATITVTTSDGGHTASCVVTVPDGVPNIYFDFTGAEGVTQSGVGYIISPSSIDLTPYIRVNTDELDLQDVKLKISSGGANASLDGRLLSFSGNGIVVIVAYSGDDAAPQNVTEIRIMHS